MTGLVVSFNCEPKKYYFTDCHHTVLETLSENIRLNVKNNIDLFTDNSFASSQAKIRINGKSDLEVLNLPWELVNLESKIIKEVDVILAADVVYDSSLFDSLCDAIRCFLLYGRCKKVYLACTERNRDTLLDFLCHLGMV